MNGACAGIIAGFPLCVQMDIPLTEYPPIVHRLGRLIGVESPWADMLVFFTLCAIYGAIFSLYVVNTHLAFKYYLRWREWLRIGVEYGLLLWFTNVLILMPVFLQTSTPVLEVGITQWILLFGHLLFGTITAVFFNLFYWKQPRIRFLSRGMGYSNAHFLGKDGVTGHKDISLHTK